MAPPKLRKSTADTAYVPTMAEHADEIHPPPPTTRNNATPSLNDARTIQRDVMRSGAPAPKPVNARAPLTIRSPFTAVQTVIKNTRRR